ncbi:unnamed protein product [Vicia faba]|uniref:Uncharacterized protein n=1 Tax=Vicia faba TaxID=3906 RepID=A0AAV1AMQ4_VICFA|nr:unnamed protein product [Vicia faba]
MTLRLEGVYSLGFHVTARGRSVARIEFSDSWWSSLVIGTKGSQGRNSHRELLVFEHNQRKMKRLLVAVVPMVRSHSKLGGSCRCVEGVVACWSRFILLLLFFFCCLYNSINK